MYDTFESFENVELNSNDFFFFFIKVVNYLTYIMHNL